MILRSAWCSPCLATLIALACSPQEGGDGASKTSASAEADVKAQAEVADAKSGAKKTSPETNAKAVKTMGRILPEAPLAFGEILGHTPAEVEAKLGDPKQTIANRISCARFLPERVFFSCEQEKRIYADTTGVFTDIQVDYEDGKAASVAVTQIKGEGVFSPENALTVVGLELPGEHRLDSPAQNVSVWEYWNAEARLLVGKKQHRVRVSVVDDQWDRSKVEIILNHPLTDDEKSRIKKSG